MLTLTEQEINDAYMRMASATLGHTHIGQAYANAKSALDHAVARAIAAGEITGKNDTERDAAKRQKFQEAYQNLAQLEQKARAAKLSLDLAEIAIRRINALLRLMECKATAHAIAGIEENQTP